MKPRSHVVLRPSDIKWASLRLLGVSIARSLAAFLPLILVANFFDFEHAREVADASPRSWAGAAELLPYAAMNIGVVLIGLVGVVWSLWGLFIEMGSLHELSTEDVKKVASLLQNDLPGMETIRAAAAQGIPLRYRDLFFVESQFDAWERAQALSTVNR